MALSLCAGRVYKRKWEVCGTEDDLGCMIIMEDGYDRVECYMVGYD